MEWSRLEPLKMLSNDITRKVFLDILFSCSWYKFDFSPIPQPWNNYNAEKDDRRKQPSGICILKKSSKSLLKSQNKLFEICTD